MRTDNPLLVSLGEARFQLTVTEEDVLALIRDGDLTGVRVRGHLLVTYDSLRAFVRRAKRQKLVLDDVQREVRQ